MDSQHIAKNKTKHGRPPPIHCACPGSIVIFTSPTVYVRIHCTPCVNHDPRCARTFQVLAYALGLGPSALWSRWEFSSESTKQSGFYVKLIRLMLAHAFLFDHFRKVADLPVSLCPPVHWAAGPDLPAEILWLDVSPFHPLRPSSWWFSSLLEEHRCRQVTGKVQSGISSVGESKEVLLHMRSSSNLSALLEASPFPKLCFTHVHKLKHYNQCD